MIPIITIDGPSGVGKGTLSQAIAKKLAWHLLDSGAIYRVFALSVINNQIDQDNRNTLYAHALHLSIEFLAKNEQMQILLSGEDVSALIRNESVGAIASKLAAIPEVRQGLLNRQRAFQQAPGLVADGRDMGTIVFPNAEVKIFLDASAEERANRRLKQLQNQGISVKFSSLLSEIQQRDDRDRHRAVAPLKPADDAFIIDSTSMCISQVIESSLEYINKILKTNLT